jgi:uncharacterized protein DUF2325
MEFLKKLALGDFSQSNAIYLSQNTGLEYSETLLGGFLRKFKRLSNHLHKYLFTKKTPTVNRIPFVKSTTQIKHDDDHSCNNDLSGQSVLCVGGRIKLYPQYREFVKTLNGNLMTFHGDTNDCLDNLHHLLENADLVICPVDCINHDAFFIVKYYCKYSGKPCVLLDHSWPTTFHKGLKTLAAMACKHTAEPNLR